MTTKELGKEALKTVLSIVGTVIGALLILSATDKFESNKKTQDALIKLDKEKASVIYVDQKCQEIKSDIQTTLTEIKDQQKINTQDTKDILKLLIDQKK